MSKQFKNDTLAIIQELKLVLDGIDSEQVAQLNHLLRNCPVVFLAGAGRSGLMARAFAMRLGHLAIKANMVGDLLTPPIKSGDLLLIVSGSGETASLVSTAKKAKGLGAVIALLTANSASALGAIADVTLTISAPTPKAEKNLQSAGSCQPMGSLFEQTVFLCMESMILELMRATQQDSATMFSRHANLE